MEELLEDLPLLAVQSEANFAVLNGDLWLVSEHEGVATACVALAKVIASGDDGAGIYRRIGDKWVVY